jgi:acyl-coenzyme A thioesterase PaaI-like protein
MVHGRDRHARRPDRDAAARCGAEVPESLRGGTVSLALDFLAPARATDVIGVGRMLRRGRSLVNCEVDVVDPAGTLIAKAIATYKVG